MWNKFLSWYSSPVTGCPEWLFPCKDQKDGDIGGDGCEEDDGEEGDENTG